MKYQSVYGKLSSNSIQELKVRLRPNALLLFTDVEKI